MRGASLIVLAWNQWPLTRRCLDSLLAGALAANDEVIVVDNGSSDETPSALAAYADSVRIVTLPENLGFVRGMNAGIAAARTDDDVVLLNNDLVFTQPDWLERLRDAAYADPDTGIVGCRLLGPAPEGRLYHAGGFIEADDLWGQQTETGTVDHDIAQFDTTRRVQAIAFAVAYIRRDCLDRIGALDLAFHSYFEDTDYCLRAADVGIAGVIAGAVTLRHDQHGSTGDDGGFRARLWAASRATFASRWQERLRARYRGQLLWQGSARFPHGHAQLARQFVRRLDARGARTAYAPVAPEIADTQDFRLDLAARRRWSPPAAVALVCATGEHFAQARGRRRIGLGFGDWQCVPTSWADGANTLDLLLVPDAFQREAFRAAGVRVPIEVLPLGVDRDYCHPRVPAPRHPRGAFVFLAVVDDLERDAPDLLARAFGRAFGDDESAELLFHVRPGRGAAAVAQALAPLVAGHANVRVLNDWGFPWYERVQLLSAVDAYVTARRGGGWDPLAAEAIACGKMLVATDFGSQRELAQAHGFAIPCVGLVDDPRYPGSRWAEPDIDALSAQLRAVHARRGDADAAARADAFAAARDIETSADILFRRIAEIGGFTPAPPPRPHSPAQLDRPAGGAIVVLGMHRSGTSSVAGLLARMGVWPGPQDDLLVGPDNPKGHYESGRLHGACLRRLAAAGGDWKNVPETAPPAAIDAFRRDLAELFATLDAQRPWQIKEPRLCLVARELLPLLVRPVFVHVVRDPHEVADSLAARDGLDRAAALALWERYNRDAFAASRGWPRLLVDYAELLADPFGVAQRLHAGLRAFGIAGMVEPDEAVARAWIEPSPPRERAPRGELGAGQQRLWQSIVDRSILDDGASASITAAQRRKAD